MVEATGGVLSTQTGGISSRTAVDSLQDQFMSLLLTEVRYQDPMNPVNDREFFTQLAQFTQVRETVSLRETMDKAFGLLSAQGNTSLLLMGSTLLGHEFRAAQADGEFAGVIEGIGLEGGSLYLVSGGCKVPLEAVTWIGGKADDGAN
jgi:flagellar basal-body rod modification protein FlgD